MTPGSLSPRPRSTGIFAAAAALALAVAGDARGAERREERGRGDRVHAERVRTEVVRREIVLRPDVRVVAIDNVFGAVSVRAAAGGVRAAAGGDGAAAAAGVRGGTAARIAVEIVQRAEARDDAALAAAFREVTLDVVDDGERLELIQDGPFRCHERRERGRTSRDGECDPEPDYRVRWEWSVEVPPGIDLVAGTVNGGALEVSGVAGSVEASNVNGPLRLTDLGGRVDASTVNGDLIAAFARAPQSGSRFETVNGSVELTLPRDTSAEVGFETLHGGIYTDFEVTPLPTRAVVARDSRARYRFDRTTVVRIGRGGVRLDCETLNGDIVLRAR
jgi:hypothetical protein